MLEFRASEVFENINMRYFLSSFEAFKKQANHMTTRILWWMTRQVMTMLRQTKDFVQASDNFCECISSLDNFLFWVPVFWGHVKQFLFSFFFFFMCLLDLWSLCMVR